MRRISSSHEIHMKLKWISDDLNFIRIAWQVHKKFLWTTHEYSLWHPWYVLHMNEPPGPSYIHALTSNGGYHRWRVITSRMKPLMQLFIHVLTWVNSCLFIVRSYQYSPLESQYKGPMATGILSTMHFSIVCIYYNCVIFIKVKQCNIGYPGPLVSISW